MLRALRLKTGQSDSAWQLPESKACIDIMDIESSASHADVIVYRTR